MADNTELTPEEENAADSTAAELANEKSELDSVKDSVSDVEEMLKSHIEKESETEAGTDDEPEEDGINYSEVDPVELAKSMADDPEGQKEFIQKFANELDIMPTDILFDDGEQVIPDELMKSINDSEESGARIIQGIMMAMEINNERNKKARAVEMQLMANMAKGFKDMCSVVEDMKKSMTTGALPPEDPPNGNDLPTLDNASGDPLSQDRGASDYSASIDQKTGTAILKKSFLKGYGDTEAQARYEEYAELLSKLGFEGMLETAKPEDAAIIRANM